MDTKSTGRPFQARFRSAIDKIAPGPKLDALTAEKVFGWKNVHKHEGSLVGKKQDKAGHWQLARVPDYFDRELLKSSMHDDKALAEPSGKGSTILKTLSNLPRVS